MNNKYGYRLVDILKRGRGRTNPLSSPRLSSPGRRGVESGARERDQSAPEMAGGDLFSRSICLSVCLSVHNSILQLLRRDIPTASRYHRIGGTTTRSINRDYYRANKRESDVYRCLMRRKTKGDIVVFSHIDTLLATLSNVSMTNYCHFRSVKE